MKELDGSTIDIAERSGEFVAVGGQCKRQRLAVAVERATELGAVRAHHGCDSVGAVVPCVAEFHIDVAAPIGIGVV